MTTAPGHIGRDTSAGFLLTPDDDLASLSLRVVVGTTAARRVGDAQAQRGVFVPVGGAVAASNNPQVAYGGADGVTSSALLAEYEPSTGRVHQLSTLTGRNPRTLPWHVGRNIRILADPAKPSRGIVVRGALMGDAGFDQHVYIGSSGPIILHHEAPGAPDNSTLGYEGDLSRNALLSDALRIGAGVDVLCNIDPKYKVTPAPGRDWVYFNGTKHGGNRFSGYLATRFAGADALLSYEAGGFVREASSLHDFALTADGRWLRRGALSIANHLWTNGNPEFDAPMQIEEVDEPPVMEPQGHPMRVHCQFDPRDTHPHPCAPGVRRKKIKWHKREPIVELPPCRGAAQPGMSRPVTGSAYGVTTLMMSGFAPLSNPRA